MLIIGALLFFYFQTKQDQKSITEDTAIMQVDTTLSAYQQFCANNTNANCGDINNFLSDKQTLGQIILMDTDEIDEGLRQQISSVVTSGSNTNLDSYDMSIMLDNLYEEKLPDDIIDENVVVKNDKMKDLHIIPVRKPPYFGNKPVVVIVIDDMGISSKRTADINSLQYPLTSAFLTYGKNLEHQIEKSKQAGHEIMLHTPMEPYTNADIAPDVLTTKMDIYELKQNLKNMLSNFKQIKGINNHMGSKLTEDIDRMTAVMEVLKEQGLFFLDSKTSSKSRAEEAAAKVGIAYAHRHVFLDNNNDKNYILGQLAQVEKLARKNGYAIAIGHPKTQTYAALKEWLPRLAEKGIKLMKLSEAVKILNPYIK